MALQSYLTNISGHPAHRACRSWRAAAPTLADQTPGACACAQGNGNHWAYTHESIDAMNRVFERFRGGVSRNRFGERVTQKLGADLSQVWLPLPPSCRHLPWHC